MIVLYVLWGICLLGALYTGTMTLILKWSIRYLDIIEKKGDYGAEHIIAYTNTHPNHGYFMPQALTLNKMLRDYIKNNGLDKQPEV
jgi:hypothetical protein